MDHKLALMASLAALALGGCAQTPVEADYGQSFKQMMQYQVYDRSPLFKPSTRPVEGADPDMLNLAVQSLRTEKIDTTKVELLTDDFAPVNLYDEIGRSQRRKK